MMVEELGLMPIDPDDSPAKNGIASLWHKGVMNVLFDCV